MKHVIVLALLVAAAVTVCFMLQKKLPELADANTSPPANASGHAPDERHNLNPLKLPLADPHILVKKSERRLTLFDGDKKLRTYRIGLGFAPTGDKTKQGDGRTPEGSFYVCVKNATSKFYLSLGLSYPGKAHAERGLREGVIDHAQHDEIINALEHKQRPPWNTGLGGEIFIHGNGSSSDWTWGCMALDNGDMKELFEAIPKGTLVIIEP